MTFIDFNSGTKENTRLLCKSAIIHSETALTTCAAHPWSSGSHGWLCTLKSVIKMKIMVEVQKINSCRKIKKCYFSSGALKYLYEALWFVVQLESNNMIKNCRILSTLQMHSRWQMSNDKFWFKKFILKVNQLKTFPVLTSVIYNISFNI